MEIPNMEKFLPFVQSRRQLGADTPPPWACNRVYLYGRRGPVKTKREVDVLYLFQAGHRMLLRLHIRNSAVLGS